MFNKVYLLLPLLFVSLSYQNVPDVYDFIQTDKTNEMPYSADFDCVQFSEMFIANARRVGISAYLVFVGWNNGDGMAFHTFVAIETEGGTLWFEPQTDQFYLVASAGESLCLTDGGCVADALAFVYMEKK